MEQKKKKGYGAGIVTGILATVLVSLLLLGGFRVITNTAGSYVSGKVTEKEVSRYNDQHTTVNNRQETKKVGKTTWQN